MLTKLLEEAMDVVRDCPLDSLHQSGLLLDRVNHNPEAARYFLAYGEWRPMTEAEVFDGFELDTARHTQIYVDFPFCKTLCNFCAFYPVLARKTDEVEGYFAALLKEIDLAAERYFGRSGVGAETVELGGGTPTVTPLPILKQVIERIFSSFPVTKGVEHSFEATPDSVADRAGSETLEFLRKAGFGRVSLGVQSFDEQVLRKMNRSHTSAHIPEALENVRRLGFDRVNFDLMLGVPNQPPEDLLESVLRSIDLGIEVIEIYTMRYFDTKKHVPATTKLFNEQTTLTGERQILAARIAADRLLRSAGYRSSNGRTYQRDEADFYASYYKENFLGNNVLGLGRKSHSNVYPFQYANYRNMEKYAGALERGVLPVAAGCRFSPKARLAKHLTGRLQLPGTIEYPALRARFTAEDATAFDVLLENFAGMGLLRSKDGNYERTEIGFFFIEEMLKVVFDAAVAPFDAERPFLGRAQAGAKAAPRLPVFATANSLETRDEPGQAG